MRTRHRLGALFVAACAGVAASAAFVSCAALDQRESGRPLDDGLAPYRRAARVEVCLGPTRLVDAAPSSGRAGVCRLDGTSPSPCTSREDCRSRESCVCGRCTAQLCRFSSDCAAGSSCAGSSPSRCGARCERDADCAPAETCEDGVCTSLCRSPDECQSGELCLSGRCVVLACGPSGPACGGGEVCDVQLEVGRLRGPAALESNGVTVLYAELGASDGSSSIIRAESEDGVRFQTEPDVAVVTPDPDQTSVGAPGPVAIDGEVHLFYEVDDGASIARRIAPDGQSFGPATTVLVPTEAWEAGRVGAPAAARVGTRTMLFYEGGDAQGIGFAVAESGVFLRVNAPVLRAVDFDSPPEWRGVERLGQPWAVVVDSLLGDRTLRLFVSGVGVENTAPRQADGGPPARNLSIGVAIAPAASEPPELEVWPFNPVLGELEALAPAAESSPTVVRVGTEWRMYFESPSGLSMAAHPPRPTR